MNVVFKGAQPLPEDVIDAITLFSAEISKVSTAKHHIGLVAVAVTTNVVPLASIFSSR